MKRLLPLLILLVGCAKPAEETTAASAPGSPAGGGGSKSVSAPTNEIPPGGLVLGPKDPNDPRFKQDPKLAGGG